MQRARRALHLAAAVAGPGYRYRYSGEYSSTLVPGYHDCHIKRTRFSKRTIPTTPLSKTYHWSPGQNVPGTFCIGYIGAT